MDFMAMAMALKAQKMNSADFKAAVEKYITNHPDAVDQSAVEAILDGRLDDIETDVGALKSALNAIQVSALQDGTYALTLK